MRKLIKSKDGSATILFFGITLALLFSAFLIIEMGSTYESYDYAMDVLQRSCNSAVEKNIRDEYRADGILKMNATKARSDFRAFVASDMPARYTVTIDSITCRETPPSMVVIGKVRFPTVLALHGFETRTFTFKVRATNYDLH